MVRPSASSSLDGGGDIDDDDIFERFEEDNELHEPSAFNNLLSILDSNGLLIRWCIFCGTTPVSVAKLWDPEEDAIGDDDDDDWIWCIKWWDVCGWPWLIIECK